MSLGRAINFVKHASYDKELRMECYKYDSKDELYTKLGFNSTEFEDAINMRLVNCHSDEEAETVLEIKLWFAML